MRDRNELASDDLRALERSQRAAGRALGRASGVQGLVDSGPTAPPVLCPSCGRDVAPDPWSYDDPPRRWCLTCNHRWEDDEGLATARAANAAIHFSTPETMAMKDRERGPVPKRPSLVQEHRERAAAASRRAKAKEKRKARRKARRR